MKKATRKQPTRLNRITGQPRKWVCYNHPPADFLLACAEALAAYHRKSGMSNRYDPLPLDVGNSVAKHLEQIAAGIRKAMERKSGLTEAELRYCELEGINQADYLSRKSGGSK